MGIYSEEGLMPFSVETLMVETGQVSRRRNMKYHSFYVTFDEN